MTQCLTWQVLSRSYCGTIILQFRAHTLFVFLPGRKVYTSQRNFYGKTCSAPAQLAIIFVLLVNQERWRPITLLLALLGTLGAARLSRLCGTLSRAIRVCGVCPVCSPRSLRQRRLVGEARRVVFAASFYVTDSIDETRRTSASLEKGLRCSVVGGSAHFAAGGFRLAPHT